MAVPSLSYMLHKSKGVSFHLNIKISTLISSMGHRFKFHLRHLSYSPEKRIPIYLETTFCMSVSVSPRYVLSLFSFLFQYF